MAEAVGASLKEHFGEVEDAHIKRSKRHKLLDILVLAICDVIW